MRFKQVLGEITLWIISFGLASGSWYMLNPETYWHRLISIVIYLVVLALPTFVFWFVEHLKYVENEKRKKYLERTKTR